MEDHRSIVSVVELLLGQLPDLDCCEVAFDRLPTGIDPYDYMKHATPTSAYRRFQCPAIWLEAALPSEQLFFIKFFERLSVWNTWMIKVPGLVFRDPWLVRSI